MFKCTDLCGPRETTGGLALVRRFRLPDTSTIPQGCFTVVDGPEEAQLRGRGRATRAQQRCGAGWRRRRRLAPEVALTEQPKRGSLEGADPALAIQVAGGPAGDLCGPTRPVRPSMLEQRGNGDALRWTPREWPTTTQDRSYWRSSTADRKELPTRNQISLHERRSRGGLGNSHASHNGSGPTGRGLPRPSMPSDRSQGTSEARGEAVPLTAMEPACDTDT